MDHAILFDVEDIFSPAEVGNDDSIMQIAEILDTEGLKGCFFFIADRAEHLAKRGRKDVIASLKNHDIGTHTPSASHPCSPEYTAGKSWKSGVAECLKREKDGVRRTEAALQKPVKALSSHWLYTSPHSQRAAALMNLPYIYSVAAAPPRGGLSWYAGALGLPFHGYAGQMDGGYFDGFDDDYYSDKKFTKKFESYRKFIAKGLREKIPFTGLLAYHPQRLKNREFVDKFWTPNGYNLPKKQFGRFSRPGTYSPSEVRKNLKNFQHLCHYIKTHKSLDNIGLDELVARHGKTAQVLRVDELRKVAFQALKLGEILISDNFSAAEMLMGMIDLFLLRDKEKVMPRAIPRHEVIGPASNPVIIPEKLALSRSEFRSMCKKIKTQVKAQEQLPANLGNKGYRVGINHIYRSLCKFMLDPKGFCAKKEVEIGAYPRVPNIATEVAANYIKVAEGPLIDPDLDVNSLYQHAKLQTWSLKPANKT